MIGASGKINRDNHLNELDWNIPGGNPPPPRTPLPKPE
jgi:hypothetical protein